MKKSSTIKRLLAGALALTMLAGAIAGCGGGDKKNAANPAAGPSRQQVPPVRSTQ